MSRDDVRRFFEETLARLRLELQGNLDQIDLLDASKLENTIDFFNQRLLVAQHEFLRYVSSFATDPGEVEREIKVAGAGSNSAVDFSVAVGAGGGTALLLNLITVPASSWFFFTTTTSAAALLGGMAGVTAGVATAGAGLAAGVGAGLLFNHSMKAWRRTWIRRSVLDSFDDDALPRLLAWADRRLENAAEK